MNNPPNMFVGLIPPQSQHHSRSTDAVEAASFKSSTDCMPLLNSTKKVVTHTTSKTTRAFHNVFAPTDRSVSLQCCTSNNPVTVQILKSKNSFESIDGMLSNSPSQGMDRHRAIYIKLLRIQIKIQYNNAKAKYTFGQKKIYEANTQIKHKFKAELEAYDAMIISQGIPVSAPLSQQSEELPLEAMEKK